MKRLKRSLALAAALISGLAFAESPIFAPNERVSVSTKPTLNTGIADLDISCSIKGASLYIDRAFAGRLPYSGRAAPGSHFLEASLPGYYDLSLWIQLEEKTAYTIRFEPELITGYLYIEVEPADASLSLDGMTVSRGTTELPVGRHTLAVKRFGYSDQVFNFAIDARRTYDLSIFLEKAPFAISGLSFSRRAFNPGNAGASGRTSLKFRASSYGSASAEIRGPGGELVATLDFPDIRTWEQSKAWDGLGPDGKALPDGPYSATLVAIPAPGVEPGEALGASAEARIDSSLVIRTVGSASAVPGLLHLPATLSQPAGTIAAEFSWFAPWAEPQASAFGLSAALSLGGAVSLAMGAAAEIRDAASQVDLALGGLVSLFGDRTSALGGALFVRGSYSSASAPLLPGAGNGIEASLPMALRLAELPLGDISLALSPGAFVDLSSSSPEFQGLARAGLWIEGRSFRAGVSGELPIGFALSVPAPLWPASAALEGRLMLGSTPLVAAAYLAAELEPGATPRPCLGVGLGLLF